jgi:hypothetical protein
MDLKTGSALFATLVAAASCHLVVDADKYYVVEASGHGGADAGSSGSAGAGGNLSTGGGGSNSCQAIVGCAPCIPCAQGGLCSGPWQACQASPACLGLDACFAACGWTQACWDACAPQFPEGVVAETAWLQCANCQACAQQCWAPAAC